MPTSWGKGNREDWLPMMPGMKASFRPIFSKYLGNRISLARMSLRSWEKLPCMLVRGMMARPPWPVVTRLSMIWVAMFIYMGTTPLGSQPWQAEERMTPRSAYQPMSRPRYWAVSMQASGVTVLS